MFEVLETKNFYSKLDRSKPCAFFDIDHTVIFPVGRKRMYRSQDNYEWEFQPNAKRILTGISNYYTIYFVTNQLKYDDIIRDRITKMMELLEIESMALIATERNIYRKPGIGLISLTDFPSKITSKCFHCGDAAGRPGDFSDDDFWFAQHAKINFFVPEDIFNNCNYDPSKSLGNPKILSYKWLDVNLIDKLEYITSNYDGIMLIGIPGSGKTTIRHFIQGNLENRGKDVTIFNNDDKLLPKEIKEDSFYILDNTNLTESLRKKYPLHILKKKIAKIYLDIDPKSCIRAIKYRVCIKGGEHIPDVTIYTMNKRKEIPKNVDLVIPHRAILTPNFPAYLAPIKNPYEI